MAAPNFAHLVANVFPAYDVDLDEQACRRNYKQRTAKPNTGGSAAEKKEPPSNQQQDADPNQAAHEYCVQRRAAKAAERQAHYALWGVGLTIPALVGLFCTLICTARAATSAARSADVAERALVDLERPHVFVEVTRAGIDLRSVAGAGIRFATNGQLAYRVLNYGRTPARLLDIMRKFPVMPQPDMPDPLPPDGPPERTLPVGIMVADVHPYGETENPRAFYGTVFYENNAPLDKRLFFMGRVRYADIFNDTYVVGFCFVFDPTWKRFVRIGDELYNYARQETKRVAEQG
jgi:hypothetical protein